MQPPQSNTKMQDFEVNPDDALERFLKLTQIRGGSGDERNVSDAIVEMLCDAGLPRSAILYDGAETRTPLKGNTGNLIITLKGNGQTLQGNGQATDQPSEAPRTLLSAHMDTVPICLGSQPVVQGDRVTSAIETGLGADDRAGCAAIVTAAVERLKAGDELFPPAVLLFTVQEEIGLKGAHYLDASLIGHVDLAFNFDGARVDSVVVGATGGERIDITLSGIPAHAGAAPEEGASAIVMASEAISKLHQTGWLGKIEKENGSGTANVGVINGGEATNVVTPLVKLRAEARSHDPDFRREIVRQMKVAFERAAKSISNSAGKHGRCEFESRVDYDSFRLADDDPSVVALEKILQAMGRSSNRIVAGGGLDANWLNQHGIPAVTIGCGQVNIHTAEEELNIAEYLDSCKIAKALICPTGSQ